MKNILTVVIFAFTMLLTVQTGYSQQTLTEDQSRPEVVAKQQTADLTKTLNLTGEQSRAVFRALVSNEINYRKHVNDKDAKNPDVVAAKSKFDTSLEKQMKTTLTKEQFATWIKLNKK